VAVVREVRYPAGLGAARAVLESGLKMRQLTHLEERLAARAAEFVTGGSP
jgi:hypothetical protein